MRESIFANAFGIGRAKHVLRSRVSGKPRAVQQVAPRAKGPLNRKSPVPKYPAAIPRLHTFGSWVSVRGNGKVKSTKSSHS